MAGRVERAELLQDAVFFEVDAFDLVIVAAAFDGAPIHDGRAAGNGVAHVRLLEDLFETGTGAAIGDELIGSEIGIASAIDDLDETEFDGVGDGDLEVQIPRGVEC